MLSLLFSWRCQNEPFLILHHWILMEMQIVYQGQWLSFLLYHLRDWFLQLCSTLLESREGSLKLDGRLLFLENLTFQSERQRHREVTERQRDTQSKKDTEIVIQRKRELENEWIRVKNENSSERWAERETDTVRKERKERFKEKQR